MFGSEVKIWPGFGIERGDEIRRALDLLGGGAEAAGDLRETAFAEVLDEPIDDAILEALLLADALELDEQALAQIARGRRRPG